MVGISGRRRNKRIQCNNPAVCSSNAMFKMGWNPKTRRRHSATIGDRSSVVGVSAKSRLPRSSSALSHTSSSLSLPGWFETEALTPPRLSQPQIPAQTWSTASLCMAQSAVNDSVCVTWSSNRPTRAPSLCLRARQTLLFYCLSPYCQLFLTAKLLCTEKWLLSEDYSFHRALSFSLAPLLSEMFRPQWANYTLCGALKEQLRNGSAEERPDYLLQWKWISCNVGIITLIVSIGEN